MTRSEAKMHTDRLRIKGYCKRGRAEDGEYPAPREVAIALGLSLRQTELDMIEMDLIEETEEWEW